ncbi:MAG TPA: response regulator [Planctomycetaceae bacterium]|jgi:DNA-binding response OmpR family regulator|nr:response regulator [Planctomycetaceae bacterium]
MTTTDPLFITQSDPTPARPPHILLAEDTDEMRAVIAMRLRQQGYSVTECADGAELLSRLGVYLHPETVQEPPQAPKYDLVISDVRMPGVFGTSIVEGASECPLFPPTILITAFGDDETHDKARRIGVEVMNKPFDMSELLEKVRTVIAGQDSKGPAQPRPH